MCECNGLTFSLRDFEVLVNVKKMKIEKCENNENKKM